MYALLCCLFHYFYFFFFFFYCSGAHRDLHSFPTRRSSDLMKERERQLRAEVRELLAQAEATDAAAAPRVTRRPADRDRKSTRLNSSHVSISYAVFCLKKKKKKKKKLKYTIQNNNETHITIL